MIRKFTKEQRQEILDDYVKRHGEFSAAGFLREVRSSNGTHIAWSWFEWNDGKAAEEFRVSQARLFVQGLKVTFEVITTDRAVRLVEAPAFISPVAQRQEGGGYTAMDVNDPALVAELRRQAARSLANWRERFGGIYESIGGDLQPLHDIEAVLVPAEQAAA